MDGVMYVIDQLGAELRGSLARIEQLEAENEQLRAAAVAATLRQPAPEASEGAAHV